MSNVRKSIILSCQNRRLNMKKVTIKVVDEGYLATDGEASLIFNKQGELLCLPMYKL